MLSLLLLLYVALLRPSARIVLAGYCNSRAIIGTHVGEYVVALTHLLCALMEAENYQPNHNPTKKTALFNNCFIFMWCWCVGVP